MNDFVDSMVAADPNANVIGLVVAADPNANVIGLGDINDFDLSQIVQILRGQPPDDADGHAAAG